MPNGPTINVQTTKDGIITVSRYNKTETRVITGNTLMTGGRPGIISRNNNTAMAVVMISLTKTETVVVTITGTREVTISQTITGTGEVTISPHTITMTANVSTEGMVIDRPETGFV
jgi:hypothetical protein